MSDPAPQLELSPSAGFAAWLVGARASLAFTTYQAGKLFLVGVNRGGDLSTFERTFDRCMGLGVSEGGFWMSSAYQLWRFENFLDPGDRMDGYDAVFAPVEGRTTGEIDVHDIRVGGDGAPIFVATRFNCLATLSARGSFRPVWRPPFIDRVAAEDRCHLNGMATDARGAPAYVTCVAATNAAGGWRDHRRDGGLVIETSTGEAVATGLSMPHSPRLYREKLWLLQTGTGEFGCVDPATGGFEPLCFLPGFARGMGFIGDHAVIGLSRPRAERTFEGLPLNDRLERGGISPLCAIAVVNLATGDCEHMLKIEGIVQELYDVAVLPDILRPMALGFRTDEIRFMVRPDLSEEGGGSHKAL